MEGERVLGEDAGLLTIKDVCGILKVKPATVYAWVAARKIPALRIHGVIRFVPGALREWLGSFRESDKKRPPEIARFKSRKNVETIIERAKREVYTSPHGETTHLSGSIGKEVRDGAV